MRKTIVISLSFFVSIPHSFANNPLYSQLASIYLPAMQESSFGLQQPPPDAHDFAVEALSDSQCRLLAFKILSQESPSYQPESCALDSKVWENLELYDGANLLNTLKRTRLKLGEASLGGMLGQPTALVSELERRKQIIKTCVTNQEFFSLLQMLLRKMGEVEPWLLTIWQNENSFLKENFNRLYLAPFLYGSSFINQSPSLLGVFRRSEDIGTFLLLPFSLLYIRHLFKNGTYQQFTRNIASLSSNATSLSDLWLSLFFSGSELLFSLLNVPISSYQIVQYHQATYQSLEYLHRRLSYLAKIIALSKDVYVTLAHHREALSHFHECKAVFDLFEKDRKSNPHLKAFLNLLESRTFSEEFSYTAHFGRILVAHKLLEEVKKDLVPLLIALGKIDAYMSCAQLFKESQKTNASFCFAHYIAKEQPSITLTNFWNPLLKAQTVVTNNLTLGHPGARSIILTGQNTGGKSTVLKGVALTILLAQTFGIAAAQQAVITPFDCLSTYMNITDNVKEGQSLFAAEVNRAKTLIDMIASLPPHKKSFVIIDEAFKGTGGEAEGLSHWYAQKIGLFPNCMCINATHYPKLTELERETNGLYHNYKVEVTINPQGKLIRRYKLERGATLQNIAEHILIEQGLK
jgi:hypothetical protein